MSEPQTITNVRVTVDLTRANGTTKTHVIEVDNHDEPIRLQIDAEVDVHDVTDVTVDRYRRREAGDRGTFKLNIAGRGPIQKRGD